MEFVDIAYVEEQDRFRQFDFYLPPGPVRTQRPPLLVFIHGGAWRDEDKADHSLLAQKLTASTGFPVVVLNYRLTPRSPSDGPSFHHPRHAEDALRALNFLLSWKGPSDIGLVYDPQSIYLIGHSCGAHMLTSIFLDSSAITPTLTPSATLSRAVKGIIMSEGIYDIDLLLASFPQYREAFVAAAFGQRESYSPFGTTQFSLINPSVRWLLIHSKGDTLLDVLQSKAMYQHLVDLNGENSDERVHSNLEELDDEHNAILRTDEYVRIVKDFICKEAME